MGQQFLSEIKLVSFNFPPKGWALCNGQLLPINQNQALFSLLGTTYGGNGQTTFALPNLQGKAPMHVGNGHVLGESAGTPTVTVNMTQLPTHNHLLNASANSAGTSADPSANYLAPVNAGYGPASTLTPMSAQMITSVGGSGAHNNMMPYAVSNFIIALQGIYPSRN
jgi:microcystin-dependent protein